MRLPSNVFASAITRLCQVCRVGYDRLRSACIVKAVSAEWLSTGISASMLRVLYTTAIFLIAFFTSVACAADKRVALVLGNSEYPKAQRLINPKNDAQDIADTLKSLGFEVILRVDADKREFTRAMAEFSRAVTDAQVALFFYAGHGMQYQGRNYLMPTDAELSDEVSIQYELISLADVQQALDRSRGTRIMVLDACRNNPLATQFSRSMTATTRTAGVVRGLAPIEQARGTVVAYSTQANEVAEDGASRNSPFTKALLEGLKEPGLEIGAMFRKVSARVYEDTKGKQIPELTISLLSELYLNQNESDAQVWRRVRAGSEPGPVRDFLNHFPQSFYAADAQMRLDALESASRERQLVVRLGALEQERKNAEIALTNQKAAAELTNRARVSALEAAKDQEIAAVEEARRNAEQRLAALQKQTEDLVVQANEARKLATETARKDQQIRAIEEARRAAEARLADLQGQTDDLRAEASRARISEEEAAAKNEQIKALEQARRSAEERVSDLQKQTDDLKEQASEARALSVETAKKDEQIRSIDEGRRKAEVQLADLQKQMRTLTVQANQARASAAEAAAKGEQVNTLERARTSAEERLASLQKQTEELKVEANAARKQAAETAKKDQQIKATEQARRAAEVRLAELQKQMQSVEASAKQARVTAVEAAAKNEQIKALEQARRSAEERLAVLQQQTEDLKTEADKAQALTAEAAKKDQQIKAMEAARRAAEARLVDLQKQTEELRLAASSASSLSSNAGAKDVQIKALEEARRTAEERLSELQTQMQSLNAQEPDAGHVPAPEPRQLASLNPEVPDEGKLVYAIGTELRRLGCYSKSPDSNWQNPGIRKAVANFANRTHLAKVPENPTLELLEDLKVRGGPVCAPTCGPREREDGGRCVAKTCGANEVLGRNGECAARAENRPARPSATNNAPKQRRKDVQKSPPRSGRAGCFNFNGRQFCE